MLDISASVNLLPYCIFKTLTLRPLKKIRIIIMLVDRLTVYPKGVLDDVLVQVNDLIFLLAFVYWI